MRKIVACLAIIVSTSSYGQTDTASVDDYDNLSLKDLLNVKIVSVSKKDESLFDAPLSASVLTKEEMQRAGCTSLMEALRLVPGMIVREQSNGNYDIHLRGMDNMPPNAPFDVTSNTTTLVMINNNPIYSYLRGGTFWETLPIDFNDVERIEVVRGPAAALYGPNAVNGVINIITRQAKKQGLYLIANSRQGSFHTSIINASVGYRLNQWSLIVSGNSQQRDRTQTSYFEYNRDRWMERPDYFLNFFNDTVRNPQELYPDPRLAMDKYAGNLFMSYDTRKIKIDLSAGLQSSHVQKVSTENEITPLSNAESDSRYVDLRATIKKLSVQFSYKNGTQVLENTSDNKYDFRTFDTNIEYDFTKGNFSLKPGLNYTDAVYDDSKYADIANSKSIFNSRGRITTLSASLRGEQKFLKNKLRLIAGAAASKFNYPKKTYISFEFAATWKLNPRHIVRAVYSKAPRSSNIFDTYVDQTIAFIPTGYRKFLEIALQGNKNLKLLTARMFEIGYRANLGSNLNIDVEVFDIHAGDHNSLVSNRPYTEIRSMDTVDVFPIISTNLPLVLQQHGITASLTWNKNKLQLKPFITLQRTIIKNYAPSYAMPDAGMGPYNIYSEMGKKERLRSTPTIFGGASVNYALSAAVNVNLNTYFYTSQTYHHLSNILFNDGIRGDDHISGKMIINASVSYEPVKGLRLFGTGKNILNNKAREFFRTDGTPFMLLAGFSYEL